MDRVKDEFRGVTPILSRYVIWRIFVPFCGILCVILLALSMERTLRLIEEITIYNAPLSGALRLLFYLLPHYLGLAIPAALFLAVLLGVRRLHEHSELVAIHATGQSLRAVWMPVLGLSLILSLCLFALVSFAQPHARYAYRAYFQDLKTVPSDIKPRPGIFQKFGTHAVIRTDRFNPDNGAIQGFFASAENDRGEKTIIGAETGLLEKLPDGKGFIIHLSNGELITKKPGVKTSVVKFEKYPWSPQGNREQYGARGQDEREMTLPELASSKAASAGPAARRAEFHARLAQVLSLPALALLAVPLALIGRRRTQKAQGMIIGVVFLISYEKILGFGESLTQAQNISPWLALWMPVLIVTLGACHLLRKRSREI